MPASGLWPSYRWLFNYCFVNFKYLKGRKVARRKCRGISSLWLKSCVFRDCLFLRQFVFWLTRHLIPATLPFSENFFFSYFFRISMIMCPILHFRYPTLFTFSEFFFPIYRNKLQNFCLIKYIFRRIFLTLQQLAALNSHDVLTFGFSWSLIPVAFSLKVIKLFSRLLRHFLPLKEAFTNS